MPEKELPIAHHPRSTDVIVWHDETPDRKPPVTESGIIGWLRTNLFGSIADTIVTIVSALFVLFLIQGFLQWAIFDAEWNVVTRNLRVLANGRYPPEELGRPNLVLIMLVFLTGFTWRLRGRAPRWLAIATVSVLLVLYIVPVFTNQIHHTPSYVYANSQSTEERSEGLNIALLLEADSEFALTLFPAEPDEGIIKGFSDAFSATEAGNAERNRRFYNEDVARAENDETVETPEPWPDFDASATVHLFDSNLQEVGTLTVSGQNTETLAIDIPSDGWYIVSYDTSGTYGAYWLEMDGYEVTASGGNALAPLTEKYGAVPSSLGEERVEFGDSGFFRFRGSRTFSEYMRLQLGPFFEAAREIILICTVVMVIGYLVGFALSGFDWAGQLMQMLWILSLFATIILLRGFHYSEYMALSRLILCSALALPALYGYLNATFAAKEGKQTALYIGLGMAVIGSFLPYLVGWQFTLAELPVQFGGGKLLLPDFTDISFWILFTYGIVGVLMIWLALNEKSLSVYKRWMAISLSIAVACFIMAQIALNTSIKEEITFIPTDRLGGVVLTLALAIVSITASFPIGVLLALGRRSELPVIKIFSVGSIEFIRGVPLITILFMATIMVPLLSPDLAEVDAVVRAMIGMTFFSAAYVAEIVRGGLQAVPTGQTEAAKAVGMSGWQTTTYIVLPQALRAVIPALVGQFISLFKDTSLVMIIGLLDLLGVARSMINQAEYIGTQREAYIFIGIVYFIGAYAMSYTSRRIEESGSGAARRL
jgi:His/Glu/Gln/Arg/opine family amino acid ABC transporter permease subunit